MSNKIRKEIDFGVRKLISQNRSKLVSIPQFARQFCGFADDSCVRIKVIEEENETYVKISAIKNNIEKINGDPSSMIGGS